MSRNPTATDPGHQGPPRRKGRKRTLRQTRREDARQARRETQAQREEKQDAQVLIIFASLPFFLPSSPPFPRKTHPASHRHWRLEDMSKSKDTHLQTSSFFFPTDFFFSFRIFRIFYPRFFPLESKGSMERRWFLLFRAIHYVTIMKKNTSVQRSSTHDYTCLTTTKKKKRKGHKLPNFLSNPTR